jgi:hypothetical protein
MSNIIDEYLVKLGAVEDAASLRQFESKLRELASKTNSATLEMTASIVKWQGAALSAFVSVTAAVANMANKVAEADQEYRLFGMTMYMNTDAAKKLKITMDALGQPLGMIAWDKELSGRAQRLLELQDTLQDHLDKEGYEENMMRVRELRFQLTELHVNFEYLEQAVVNGLVKAFGPQLDAAIEKLQQFNLWFAQHLPEIRDKVNRYLIPILKDAWVIIKDMVRLLSILANAFADVINTLAGDDTMDQSMDKWEKFALAIEHCANAVAFLLDKLIKIEKFLAPHAGTLGGAWAGAKIGGIVGPEGALVGGITGAVFGGVVDIMRARKKGAAGGGAPSISASDSIDSGGMAQRAAALAQSISARTGIPADLIWAQWAHETGGFTNRGARELNNLAGVNVPGGTGEDYRSFSSLEDFGDYYVHLMRPGGRYSGVGSATTAEEFSARLKQGGYYSAPQSEYTAGIERWDRKYSGAANSLTVGSVNVHINQPNVSAEEIQQRVMTGVSQAFDAQVQRNLNEFAGGYG